MQGVTPQPVIDRHVKLNPMNPRISEGVPTRGHQQQVITLRPIVTGELDPGNPVLDAEGKGVADHSSAT